MNQAEKFMCGKHIGSGLQRDVYEYNFNTDYVIKVAKDDVSQNVIENEIWSEVQFRDISKWFAPCIRLSICGKYLVQEKIKKIPHDKYPDKIPHFFADTKYANYGKIGKNFVCCDYGTFVLTNGFTNRMKKAKWWHHEGKS